MRKIFLGLVFVFLVAAISGAANATVEKYTPLVDGEHTTCKSDFTQYVSHVDWAATCTTNGVTSEIKGVVACSNQKPDSCASDQGCDLTYSSDPTMKQETITTSDNADENTNCWCKIISPTMSPWVFSNSFHGDAGLCAMFCAGLCAYYIQNLADFRSAL